MDENLASIMISGQYIIGYLFSSVAMLRSGIESILDRGSIRSSPRTVKRGLRN